MKIKHILLFILIGFNFSPALSFAQDFTHADSLRGALTPFRTCYDVHWYDLKVKEQQLGDILLPNAPKHKFGLGGTYRNDDIGLEIDLNARNIQPFEWAAGVFQGDIPAYTLVNLSAGYQLSRTYRIGLAVSNVLDHEVYQLFGGAVIGRQAIGTITATF